MNNPHKQNFRSNEITLANKSFLRGDYEGAAKLYDELYKKWPFDIYKKYKDESLRLAGKLDTSELPSITLNTNNTVKTICICTSGAIGPTGAGGIATAMANLAVELSLNGYQVTIIYAANPYYARENLSFWQNKYKELYNIEFIGINKDKYYGTEEMVRSYEVLKILRQRNFDAAIFHDYQGLGYFSTVARRCGLLDKTAIIINGHGNQELSYTFGSKIRSTLAECVIRQLEVGSVSQADAFVTPSTFYMEFWSNLTKIPATSKVIHNFNESETEENLLKGLSRVSLKKRTFNNDKENYFFYSRLERLKGLDLFIDFAIEKTKIQPSAYFWFYGTAVDIDGIKSDEYINKRLNKTGVKFSIILNPKPSEFFEDIRSAKGILIFSSLGENSPCTVVEACIHSTPMLAADIPGVVELLSEDSRNRCLFKTGNLEDLLRSSDQIEFGKKVPTLSYTKPLLLNEWDKLLKNLPKLELTKASETPKVSVIIPTIGRIETLRQTLIAFKTQSYRNHEIIVVDDSGKENSGVQDLCNEFSVNCIKTNKVFKGTACNMGANIAEGEYIIFFDDDDIPSSNYISTMVTAFERSDADIVSTFAAVFSDSKSVNPEECVEYVSMAVGGDLSLNIMANYFGKGCFGVRTNFFRKIGGYDADSDLTPFVDYRFYIKCSINKGDILVIPEPLYYYRKNSNGSLFSEMNKTPLLYSAKSKIFNMIKDSVDPMLHLPLKFYIENISLPKIGVKK